MSLKCLTTARNASNSSEMVIKTKIIYYDTKHEQNDNYFSPYRMPTVQCTEIKSLVQKQKRLKSPTIGRSKPGIPQYIYWRCL